MISRILFRLSKINSPSTQNLLGEIQESSQVAGEIPLNKLF